MNTVKNILDVLQSDILNIKIVNGYNSDVKDVSQSLETLDKITDTIKVNLIVSTDKIKEETESGDIREIDIIVIAHCDINEEDTLFINDFINQLNSNVTAYPSTLGTIANITKITIVEKNYAVGKNQTKKTVGVLLRFEYLEILDEIENTLLTETNDYLLLQNKSVSKKLTDLTLIDSAEISDSDLMYLVDNETNSSYKTTVGDIRKNISSSIDLNGYVTTSSFNNHTHTKFNNNVELTGSLFVSKSAVITDDLLLGDLNASNIHYRMIRTTYGDFPLLAFNQANPYFDNCSLSMDESKGLCISAKTGHKILFRNNNITKAVINENGNLGIGNFENPTSKLHISGSTASEGLLNIQNNNGTNIMYVSSSGNIEITGNLSVSSDTIINGNLTTTNVITGSVNTSLSPFISTGSNSIYSTNPLSGEGTATENSFFMGTKAGYNATEAYDSNFLGENAGYNATYADDSNFLGMNAGYNATEAYYSNFLGMNAGNNATEACDSNFLGENAGNNATDANNSNFLGCYAGYNATGACDSNFLGCYAGFMAANASYSTLIGYNVGNNITGTGIGSNNIIIGTNITLENDRKDSINLGGIIFATGSYSNTTSNPYSGSMTNGKVGIGTTTPNATLDVNGNVIITGSLIVSGGMVPTSISSSGVVGQTAWDSNYYYVCIGTNTWKRFSLNNW